MLWFWLEIERDWEEWEEGRGVLCAACGRVAESACLCVCVCRC